MTWLAGACRCAVNAYPADAYWYGNCPRVIMSLKASAAAERLIPAIKTTIQKYPYSASGSYLIWPGPNSNTFVVVDRAPYGWLRGELSPVAVGRISRPGLQFARAPSDTGYTVSVNGYFRPPRWRLRKGWKFTLPAAPSVLTPMILAIKLPAFGKLSMWDLLGLLLSFHHDRT